MKCKLEKVILNYKVKGKGKPILMLNGYATDMNTLIGCMEPIFKDISGWKRIYIDHPGVGETKIKSDSFSYKDMI
ncbi:MAG: hypothetical protein FH751_06130 [Firmicutes bacterium]|nr:hypothetical protein [Bacillota bacterium]